MHREYNKNVKKTINTFERDVQDKSDYRGGEK